MFRVESPDPLPSLPLPSGTPPFLSLGDWEGGHPPLLAPLGLDNTEQMPMDNGPFWGQPLTAPLPQPAPICEGNSPECTGFGQLKNQLSTSDRNTKKRAKYEKNKASPVKHGLTFDKMCGPCKLANNTAQRRRREARKAVSLRAIRK
jgi:hypothetical protein